MLGGDPTHAMGASIPIFPNLDEVCEATRFPQLPGITLCCPALRNKTDSPDYLHAALNGSLHYRHRIDNHCYDLDCTYTKCPVVSHTHCKANQKQGPNEPLPSWP